MDCKEFLVSVEIAKALKKIGFDSPCLFIYRNGGIFLEGTASVGFSIDPNEADFVAAIEQLWEVSNQEGADWVTVPTYEQVFAWFRDREIYGHVARDGGGFYKFIVSFGDGEDYYFDSSVDEEYGSYEYARIKCIEGLIEAYKEVRE